MDARGARRWRLKRTNQRGLSTTIGTDSTDI